MGSQSQSVYSVGQRVLVVPVGHHPLRLSAVVTESKGSFIHIKYEHFVYADDEDCERLHIVDDAHRICCDENDLMDESEMEQLHNAMSRRCTSVGTVMSMASAVSVNTVNTAAAGTRRAWRGSAWCAWPSRGALRAFPAVICVCAENVRTSSLIRRVPFVSKSTTASSKSIRERTARRRWRWRCFFIPFFILIIFNELLAHISDYSSFFIFVRLPFVSLYAI